ncbi:MAG: hypothetical protein ACFFCS_21820 [Candidatus Hodarchaeota archaeon]
MCSNLVIVVDLVNVMMTNKTGKKGKLSYYQLMKEKLDELFLGNEIYYIADASGRHRVDDKDEFERLCQQDWIIQTPAGEDGDYYMLQFAQNKANCIVISRDQFKNYNLDDRMKQRVIPFSIIGEEVIFSKKMNKFKKKKPAGKLVHSLPSCV